MNAECRRLASASKDMSVRVWDIISQDLIFSLTSHTASVTKVNNSLITLL